MKLLPKKSPPLRAKLFADGANGYALQVYTSDDFDCSLRWIRQNRNDDGTKKWFSQRTGDDEFDTYDELRAAWLATVPTVVK